MPRTQFAHQLLGDPLRRVADDIDQDSALHEPDHEAPEQSTVHRTLQVGAADDRAEHEADAVADQVLARLAVPHEHVAGCDHDDAAPVRRSPGPAGTATIGAAGGDLDADSTGAIESARGTGSTLPAGIRDEMETGFGESLSDVRIHTDERAAGLSRGMSARAFTTGSDIFFDKGEFAPDTAEGKRVLAHEIAHTRQDAGVRRKLRGTADALLAQGDEKGDGGKSSGFLRKVTGKLTNWDKIVGAVKAYEAEESKLLAGGKNPDPMSLMTVKPGMLKLLRKVQDFITEWRKANRSEDEDSAFEESRNQVDKKGNKSVRNQGADNRSKNARRQAVALLEPRVGNEMQLLSANDAQSWLGSLGLSSAQGTATGVVLGGQMNTVTEVAYKTEGGDLTGFFKEDKGFNADLLEHETGVGIKQIDPNYGARSVALYRLDQLFNANVTARAEFAVHQDANGKSKLGTVLESAKGKAGGDLNYGMGAQNTKDMRNQGGENANAVSMNDPVLQRGLNKLQILDAIAGQLDRHMGNYYVDSDKEGNVTGVTGIDLDMAFGSSMKGIDKASAPGAFNYKGLPEFIDEEMGLKILQIQPGDIRAALTGLLPKGEVDATVSRFREVQTAVMDAQQSGKLRAGWGQDATTEGSTYGDVGDRWHQAPTYLDEVKIGPKVAILKSIASASKTAVDTIVAQRDWQDLPDDVPPAIAKAFGFYREGQLMGPFKALGEVFWTNSAMDKIDPVITDLVVEAMKRASVNRIWVDLQEGKVGAAPGDIAKQEMEKRLNELVAARLPQISANLKKKPAATRPGRR